MSNEIRDQVPADSMGAREIGFAVPEVYNASRVLFDNPGKGRGDKLALMWHPLIPPSPDAPAHLRHAAAPVRPRC